MLRAQRIRCNSLLLCPVKPPYNPTPTLIKGELCMPIYEYECQQCGHHLEVLQKISDAPLTKCPACQADALKKLVSAAGFRLSGSGWYETDFKSKNKKNLAQSDSQSSKSSESSKSSDGAKKSEGSKKTASKTSSSSASN